MAETKFTSFAIMAEQVIKILEARDTSDSRYDEREVIRLLRNQANKLLMADTRQAWVDGERTVDVHYIANYRDIDIKTDSTTGEIYSDIPATYLPLYTHKGIQRVVPVDSSNKRGRSLVPIDPFEMDIYRRLPAGGLDGLWCYEPRIDKIIYPLNYQNQPITKKYKKVDMELVSINFYNKGDDDQIPLPENLYDDMIKGVLEILLPVSTKPVDIVNDNNPNIVRNG